VAARRRHKQKPAVMSGRVEIPDAEHELVIERVAAIDVAKGAGKVCVRLPDKSGRRFSRVWDVPARTGAIGELAEQLIEARIEKVTIESTSDYWRIWYYLLEAAGLSVQLVNARDVKNVPGRPKTDKLDAVWLAKLTEKGLLRPSFVPPAEIRRLRDYTRLRVNLRPHPLLAAAGKAARGRTDQNLVGGLNPGHAVHPRHDRGSDRWRARPLPAGRAGPREDEGQTLAADHRARRSLR
jgi:transposase